MKGLGSLPLPLREGLGEGRSYGAKIGGFLLRPSPWPLSQSEREFQNRINLTEMQIITFTTEIDGWQRPRVGILLNGYRLDCESLFEASERPDNFLSWFDM